MTGDDPVGFMTASLRRPGNSADGPGYFFAAIVALAAVGCVPPHEPAPPPPPTVSLRMRGAPPEASVVIDDEPLGSLDFVAAHGVALPPGKHLVTVSARGYLPMDREVDALAGGPPIVLLVTLTPVPD